MSKIFKGQTALRITLTCGRDISEAQETKIKYRKPDGTEGEWDAIIDDSENGVMYYDVADETELDIAGTWRFWSFVTFGDGRSAPGDPVKVRIAEEGN